MTRTVLLKLRAPVRERRQARRWQGGMLVAGVLGDPVGVGCCAVSRRARPLHPRHSAAVIRPVRCRRNVRVRSACPLVFGRACTYATVLALLVLARSTIMPSGRWRVGCGICTVEKSRSVGLLNYRGSCVYYCGRTYDGRRGHGVVRWYVEPVEAAERRRHQRRALDRKAVVILETSARPWRRRQ